ncbi:anhydro-N-acetylmuramic acid kinase [Pelagibacterales bacterium SAG-MED43]|nr:anhydro-N-acetylmuramic acid kinase [Pelagibacterales bacterium SAG-MED43]
MKKKIFTALGLMSGTSMDGVDLSLIKTDGHDYYAEISDKYYQFDDQLFKDLIRLRENIRNSEDLKKKLSIVSEIEKKFTLFNANIIKKFIDKEGIKPNLIGIHGQTIYHNVKDKISRQIVDGNLLSQLIKCIVINKFRQQDLDNGGQGAPLTPVFHYLISKKLKKNFRLSFPINIINIGGITNVTTILKTEKIENDIHAYDIAPGNCLINEWMRINSNKKFDNKGAIALSGKINELFLNQAKDNFEISSINESMDTNDFDISFAKGLSFEDGCATLTEFTAYLISEGLKKINKINNTDIQNLIICGGGRKNKTLIKKINQYMNNKKLILTDIDKFKLNGDFVESQAFAYLAVRRFLNLPISFPNTTRCLKQSLGGQINKNF